MKKLLALLVGLLAVGADGAVYQNYFTYSASPGFTNAVYHNGAATFYPTLSAAVAAASAGDYIEAAPQTHSLSNALVIPVGSTINLTGSKIISYIPDLASNGPAIQPRDNSTVVNAYVVGGFRNSNTNATYPQFTQLYQASFGWHQNAGSAATNVIFLNPRGGCGSDTLFIKHTNVCQATLFNPNFDGTWDNVTLQFGAHQIDLMNPLIQAIGTNYIKGSGGKSTCINFDTATGSRVRVYGGTLVASNSAGVNIDCSASTSGAVQVEVYNASITNMTGNTQVQLGDNNRLIIGGCVGVDPAKIADSLAGAANIFYLPLTANSIRFGGTQDDGYGPILTNSAGNVALRSGYFIGNGFGLTNIPNSAIVVGAQTLFRTNAPAGDGTYTNSNSGGASNVYVGPAYLAITNGGVVNVGKTPGMLRLINNGVGLGIASNTAFISTLKFTNDAATTSGGNMDASAFAWQLQASAGAAFRLKGSDATHPVIIQGSAGGNDFNVNNGGVMIGGTNYTLLRTLGGDFVSTNTVTATNGFYLPQLTGIPSGVDLRSSSGNTNWLLLNLGGGVALLKTNPAAASSYFTNWQTVQLDFVEGNTAGTPVSLTTATAANITSISLTPGTWDLTGNIYFDFVGATVISIEGAISTTSATISSPPPEDVSAAALNLVTTSSDSSLNITRRRVTITANTTYYLVGRASFSAGSIDGYGKLLATRVN